MNKTDIMAIAEGLKQIEEGVEQIQNVMRKHKIKSLSEIAAELIPFFKKDDESLTESIIERLE
jgi:hypothetical protein